MIKYNENVIYRECRGCFLEEKLEEKKAMPRLRKTNWLPIVLGVMLLITVILIIPISVETQIHVLVSVNQIENVWVETPRTPLISKLFVPSHATGVYTINVTVTETQETFLIQNVPEGEYFVVWVTIGVPSEGIYEIEVRLIKNDIIVHTFETNVSF